MTPAQGTEQDEPTNDATAAQLLFDAAVAAALNGNPTLDPQVALNRALNAYNKAHA